MKITSALILSIKYHILALIPTILGLATFCLSMWFGLVEPLLDMPSAYLEFESIIEGDIVEHMIKTISFPVIILGTISGYIIHRIGRTAILMKVHGKAIVSMEGKKKNPEKESSKKKENNS